MNVSDLNFRATIFMSLTNGGHVQGKECVKFPEFTVSSVKQDRNSEWVKTFRNGGTELSFEEFKNELQLKLDSSESST